MLFKNRNSDDHVRYHTCLFLSLLFFIFYDLHIKLWQGPWIRNQRDHRSSTPLQDRFAALTVNDLII